jgi:hypothetical protein
MTEIKSPYPTHLPCSICGELIEIKERYRSSTTSAVHPECLGLGKDFGKDTEKHLKMLQENRHKFREAWNAMRARDNKDGGQ